MAVCEPHYPKGKRGRPLMGVERMLRRVVVQQCLGLSDAGIEDAIYASRYAASLASTLRSRLRPMPPRVSPVSAAARSDSQDFRHHQRPSGQAGSAAAAGDHGRCHDHGCTQLHEEP